MDAKTVSALFVKTSPYSVSINGALAKEIGLNESIVLLQLDYLITTHPHERDGKMWTYQSTRDMKERYFPWWGLATINRTIQSLEELGLIHVGNYNKASYDRTRWFAMNIEGLSKLHSLRVIECEPEPPVEDDDDEYGTASTQNGTPSTQNGTASAQDGTTIPQKSSQRPTQKKNKTAGAKAPAAKSDPRSKHPIIQAIRNVTARYPAKPQYGPLIDAVGDRPIDESLLKTCYDAWVLKGWNPSNYAWVTEWYVKGGPQGRQTNNAPVDHDMSEWAVIAAQYRGPA
jgi:hypothetical protein